MANEAPASTPAAATLTPRGRFATFSSLQYRDFRLLWLGQVGHAASLWMEQIVRPLLILALTDSALMVGLVVAARMVPMLLFGLLAGVAADRLDRKKILLTTQSVTLSMHVLMAALIFTDVIQPWHVFATTFISGTSMAFNQPSRQSLIPQMVPKEQVLNAVALNTTAINLMRVLGPAMAGLLLFTGFGAVYALNAAMIGGVMVCTVLMQVKRPVREKEDQPGWLDDLKESFAFVARTPAVFSVMGPAFILFIFGLPYQSVFVPLFAKRVLDIGDSGAAALVMVTGVGAIIGSLVIASQASIRRRGRLLIVFLAVFSLGLIVFSRSTFLPASVVFLMITASMSTSYLALTNTLLLELSPDDMHGRVMSLLSLDRGLVPLGATIAGALAAGIGPEDGLLVMGAVCLALTILTAIFAKPLREI